MVTDMLRFMKFYKAIQEQSYFTIIPMSYMVSGKYVEGTTLLLGNGMERYILEYRTQSDGRIWSNIRPDVKGGTALPATA